MSSRTELLAQTQRRAEELGIRSNNDLIDICRDPNKPLPERAEAVSLLGSFALLDKLGTAHRSRVIRILIDILQEGKIELAWNAAKSLGIIGGNDAVDALLEAASRATENGVRLASVHALGLTADPRAAGVLLRILANRSESPRLRGEAAEALAFCGQRSSETSSALIEALTDDSVEVRFFAAHALGMLNDARAIPALERRLNDNAALPGYGSVAEEAAASLRQLRSESG